MSLYLFFAAALLAACTPINKPGSTTPGGNGDTVSAAHWFSSDFFFNQAIDASPVDSQSALLISRLASRGGWGNAGNFQIDFSLDVHYTSSPTTYLPFKDLGVIMPDSDLPTQMPVPQTGTAGFESSSGKTCDGGDCHYLVVDEGAKKLYETYQGEVSAGFFQTDQIVAAWDFTKQYPSNLRGDVCTSADAGGFPIAPMLFTAEEVKAGKIDHAIRFILPNNRIQCREYVRPATHGTGTSNCAGWANADGIPYGARLRLKSTYSVDTLPSEGAKVVARALQKYGMILADGGQIALTAKSDASSTTKWTDLLGPFDLQVLQVTDFEMVEAGARFDFTSFDCTRTSP